MDRNYYLGFSVFSGIGPVKFYSLLKHFGSGKNAWERSTFDLKPILGNQISLKFEKFRQDFSPGKYEKKLKEKDVWFVIQEEKEYPKLLKETPKAPIVLYGKGDKNFAYYQNPIGIVGSRKTTYYGREVTKALASNLAISGFTVVSGLAMGVDAVAAQSAIEAGKKTVAVLGCGVDLCFPSSNRFLYEKIINGGGAVISEVPLSEPPSKGLFPARNRIIAGLSLGVLVTEGAEDSGSLITAEEAFKINRPVFAVPGPINSTLSKGPYKLIEKGAKLVTRTDDIVSKLNIKYQKSNIHQRNYQNLTKEEEKVVQILKNEPLDFDSILRNLKTESGKLLGLISVLEIKGVIKNENGLFLLSE